MPSVDGMPRSERREQITIDIVLKTESGDRAIVSRNCKIRSVRTLPKEMNGSLGAAYLDEAQSAMTSGRFKDVARLLDTAEVQNSDCVLPSSLARYTCLPAIHDIGPVNPQIMFKAFQKHSSTRSQETRCPGRRCTCWPTSTRTTCKPPYSSIKDPQCLQLIFESANLQGRCTIPLEEAARHRQAGSVFEGATHAIIV